MDSPNAQVRSSGELHIYWKPSLCVLRRIEKVREKKAPLRKVEVSVESIIVLGVIHFNVYTCVY